MDKQNSVQGSNGINTVINEVFYSPRMSRPEKWNKYYIRKDSGGYSSAVYGLCKSTGTYDPQNNVLANCVGYAYGRFHEIIGDPKMSYLCPVNAENFPEYASKKLKKGSVPQVGAVMVWQKGGTLDKGDGAGHVAVVEKVISDTEIIISQSGYKGSAFWTETLKKKNNTWKCSYMNDQYTFRCFIYNPAVSSLGFTADNNVVSKSQTVDAISSADPGADKYAAYNQEIIQQQQTVLASTYNNTRGMDLLSSNSLVESPFIILKIGNYTFGSYTREGTLEKLNSTMKVTYPNYMKSISIIKTNGVLNQYTVEMTYQIVPGKDPNLLDRIFSTVSGSREVTLSYGDWASPSFIYKEEQAILTQVTSQVDFASQCITYSLSCTSKALQAAAQTFHFPRSDNKKGSEIVRNLLSTKKYGLADVFPAMSNAQFVDDNGLIPGDDKVITLEAKDMDPLKYLNYVVGCMSAITNSDTAVIKDSTYHLIINDDLDGLYFKIVKVGTSTRTAVSENMYEVDIGYPTSTMVTNFEINTDNSWALLYNYNNKINLNNYVYTVGDDGQIRSDYVDSNTGVSAYYNRVTEINKTWWTKMTQFPITATLTIKGLLRPALLMTYLRINSYFFGQRHISSGLYIITKQEDEISETGYRTTLSLTRIAGDDDSTYNYNQTYATNTVEEKTVNKVNTEAAAKVVDSAKAFRELKL